MNYCLKTQFLFFFTNDGFVKYNDNFYSFEKKLRIIKKECHLILSLKIFIVKSCFYYFDLFCIWNLFMN